MRNIFLFITTLLVAMPVMAAEGTVKYKEAKDLDFDQLIIEGQMRLPELSVVTGDDEQGTNGLLKLREDFVDKMTADASEQIP